MRLVAGAGGRLLVRGLHRAKAKQGVKARAVSIYNESQGAANSSTEWSQDNWQPSCWREQEALSIWIAATPYPLGATDVCRSLPKSRPLRRTSRSARGDDSQDAAEQHCGSRQRREAHSGTCIRTRGEAASVRGGGAHPRAACQCAGRTCLLTVTCGLHSADPLGANPVWAYQRWRRAVCRGVLRRVALPLT